MIGLSELKLEMHQLCEGTFKKQEKSSIVVLVIVGTGLKLLMFGKILGSPRFMGISQEQCLTELSKLL